MIAKEITSQSDLISLDISSTKSSNNPNSRYVKFTVSPKADTATTSVGLDLICLIDVSGSMASEAQIKNSQNISEGNGLSILDLVKHSVRTIIHNLSSNDRLSLVSFHSEAKKITDLTTMNDEGKTQTLAELDLLTPLDCTNIWDGLQLSLDIFKADAALSAANLNNNQVTARKAISQILLFTDGQPNVEPPRGHLPTLQKYKKDNPQVTCTISTFGFGYNLDSDLLNALALEGSGSFAFIPDGSFVGTIFVNAFSNLKTTVAVQAQLQVSLTNNAEIKLNSQISRQSPTTTTTDTTMLFDLGAIRIGSHRDVVLDIDADQLDFIQAKLIFKDSSNALEFNSITNIILPADIKSEGNENNVAILNEKYRILAVDAIDAACKYASKQFYDEAKNIISNILNQIKTEGAGVLAKSEQLKDLVFDLEGQATEAVSRADFFTRWGKHYLLSLQQAHRVQECNNFKDPGVQHYGGKLFNTYRDKSEEIFLTIPPPVGSIQRYSDHGSSSTSSNPVSMGAFYSNKAPCFDGDCEVLLGNGTTKKVRDIRKGDIVASVLRNINGASSTARVKCVIQAACENNKAFFVNLQGGLKITPYHPILLESGEWKFPCDVVKEVLLEDCEYLYSFVLEENHVMIINGISCVTYAHGFQEEVVRHEYFGSQEILRDFEQMIGWDHGFIVLPVDSVERHPVTKNIIRIRQSKESNQIESNRKRDSLQLLTAVPKEPIQVSQLAISQ